MGREMTSKEIRKQSEIINQWIEDCAIAYNIPIDDVTDNHIISYLAQVQLGVHDDCSCINCNRTIEDVSNALHGHLCEQCQYNF